MGFQLKCTFCSKTFATGPSKLSNVVCQIENQAESRNTQGDHILQVPSRQKTEPNLKLYGGALKVSPQVKFPTITFDSQLTFRKHFEDNLDRCNIRYHRLKLQVNQKWGPSPSTVIQIYKQCIGPTSEYGSFSTVTTSNNIISKFNCSKTNSFSLPSVYQNTSDISYFITPLASHM